MKAADVMVRNVITVGPDACVQDVAPTLLTTRISGVPVVGPNGKLVGIVSEGDLMRRVEAGTGRRRPWWLAILTGKEALAMEFIRLHSRKVADVMTREVITAAPDTPLWDIANLLEKNRRRAFTASDGWTWSACRPVARPSLHHAQYRSAVHVAGPALRATDHRRGTFRAARRWNARARGHQEGRRDCHGPKPGRSRVSGHASQCDQI